MVAQTNIIDPTRIFIAQDKAARHSTASTVFGNGPKNGYVSAPLPDGWGIPVENELTQPFADFVPQGPIQTLMALASTTGASLAQGYVVRKFFASTGIPDLTFDLSFVAYNDAFEEVISPVYWLYAWSAPKKTSSSAIDNTIAKFGTSLAQAGATGINSLSSLLGSDFSVPTGTTVTAKEVNDIVNWLEGPPEVQVIVGNLYHVNGLIISNMEPKFSNNLDYNGLPMQCDVSITLSLREPFTLGRVHTSFASQFGNT